MIGSPALLFSSSSPRESSLQEAALSGVFRAGDPGFIHNSTRSQRYVYVDALFMPGEAFTDYERKNAQKLREALHHSVSRAKPFRCSYIARPSTYRIRDSIKIAPEYFSRSPNFLANTLARRHVAENRPGSIYPRFIALRLASQASST